MNPINSTASFKETFANVAQAVKESGNEALSFYYNSLLISQISASIAKRGINTEELSSVRKILKQFDFRVVADYLNFTSADKKQKELFEKILTGEREALYEYQNAKFLESPAARSKTGAPAQTIGKLEDIFTDEAQGKRLIYFYDKAAASASLSLFSEIGNRIGAFLDSQLDLPGVNSLVREGLVKSFVLSNGTAVISKRNNPAKKGRFLTEQQNVQKLIGKLGLPEENSTVDVGTDTGGDKVLLSLIRPFAVLSDPDTKAYYSLSNYAPHPTLEQIFLEENEPEKRKEHLSNCRKILERLYDKGIVWGDMAPRNILVDRSASSTIYHVLDFEKTDIRNEPVPLNDRIEHCRGPMCVEEFGAVCDCQEVKACFAGYFDPNAWDVSSKSPVQLKKPKREVVDILAGRGKTEFAFGDYNKAEQEIIGIRFPYFDSKGERRFPLHVSFKVDHYYGAEYDRRTTEVLMAAKRFDALENVQNWLEAALDDQDNQKLFSPFAERKGEEKHGMNARIKEILDVLYDARMDQGAFAKIVDRLNLDYEFHAIRQEHALTPLSGGDLAAKNTALISKRMWGLQEAISEKFGDKDYLVYISGSYSRGEFTFGSDLDIGVVAKEEQRGKEIEKFISGYAKDKLQVPFELYPLLTEETLPSHLEAYPADGFIDFAWAKVLCGDRCLKERFDAEKEAKLNNKMYQGRARKIFEALPDGLDTASPKALLKKLSFGRALAFWGNLCGYSNESLNHQLDIALFLKNEQDNANYGRASGYVPISQFMNRDFVGTNPFFPERHRSPGIRVSIKRYNDPK